VMSRRAFCIVRSSVGCERQVLQLGAQGGERKRGEERRSAS
jgi:hypothetical protein